MYGAETLACIAIGDQNRPEGPVFFACSRPTAPKGSLVCPQITRCNHSHSPNPPSSVQASYVLLLIDVGFATQGYLLFATLVAWLCLCECEAVYSGIIVA